MKNSSGMAVMARTTPGSSAVDSNRFYSMLLDARSANVSVSENMYDVSEKLLKGEKDNAKLALDQLWSLKKALTDDQTDETIDRMIGYYQEKINALREKEESIKKVGKVTRALADAKKKRDEELAHVKAQIADCTRDMRDLKQKLETLCKREQELVAAERKLKKEIGVNETLIVNGLYDIILRRPDTAIAKETTRKDADADTDTRADADSDYIARELAQYGIDTSSIHKKALAAEMERDEEDDAVSRSEREDVDVLNRDEEQPVVPPRRAQASRPDPILQPIVYPKSVVRMSGKVIGEYYHDGNAVAKDKRHYIYNSRFMSERLIAAMRSIKTRFSQEIHAEMVKLVDDATNRVRDNARFHFEVSTNEILNDKNLKQLAADLKRRAWDDAERFAIRLAAKIEALGSNYEAMLQEQMERCAEKN